MFELTPIFTDISTDTIHEQIKITNTSDDYLNDVLLTIDTKNCPLTYQVVKRERGTLDFSPPTLKVELGNLAPNESAYFEYKGKLLNSLINQLSLTCKEHEQGFSLVSKSLAKDLNKKDAIKIEVTKAEDKLTQIEKK